MTQPRIVSGNPRWPLNSEDKLGSSLPRLIHPNMAANDAPWRSPLSTAISKDENGTKDTFQHLEKLLASAVSICRLKGTLECQTGGLITVCEEMQRLLRCCFSEIMRLEKDMQKLQTNHKEELAHLKKKITTIEQEKDAAKLVLENLIERLDCTTRSEEELESNSENVGAASYKEPVMDSRVNGTPGSSEVNADGKVCDVNDIEDPVEGKKSNLCQGSNMQSESTYKDSNDKDSSRQVDGNKCKPLGGEVCATAAVEGLPVSQTRAKNRLSRFPSKKTAKQSHGASLSSEDINNSDSNDTEQIPEEDGKTPSIDKTNTEAQSGKKKLRISRNSTKGNPKKLSDASESKLPAESANSEVFVLEVKGNEMEGGDADMLMNAPNTKYSQTSASKKKKAKASRNLSRESSEPGKETTEKMQKTESSYHDSLSEKLQTPKNRKKNEEEEPLGDMSFLLDVNLKISEFVTNSEQELELEQMTERQRTDVYKLVELYKVRVRMGSKSNSLTTLRLSKTPASQMPKNGKVDCLLSKLSITATKEARRDSPKLRAGKRKKLSDHDNGSDATTQKHLDKKNKRKKKII